MSDALVVSVDAGGVDAVTALLDVPDKASHLLVLGHGAGAGMRHGHMENITTALNLVGIAVLRFQFPYMELGKNRTDRPDVCGEVISKVVDVGRQKAASLPMLLGGHSFGGRMASHAVVDNALDDVIGLVFFSFPLHMSSKPSIKRATHLPEVGRPMLFLSGSRDKMAQDDQLAEALAPVDGATVHRLFTGDHGFKILKRTRTDAEDVYTEAARVTQDWIGQEQL